MALINSVPIYNTSVPVAPSVEDYANLFTPVYMEADGFIYLGVEWESATRAYCRNADNWICRYVDLIERVLGYHDGSGPWETLLPPVRYSSLLGKKVALHFEPLYRHLALLYMMHKPIMRQDVTGRHIHISIYRHGKNLVLDLFGAPLSSELLSSLYLLCGEVTAENGVLKAKCRERMGVYVTRASNIVIAHYNIVNINEKRSKDNTIEIRTNELVPPLSGVFLAPILGHLLSLIDRNIEAPPLIRHVDDILAVKQYCADDFCIATIDILYDYLKNKKYFFQTWKALVDMGLDLVLDGVLVEFVDVLESMKDKPIKEQMECIGYCSNRDIYLDKPFSHIV